MAAAVAFVVRHLYCATGAQVALPSNGWGVMVSQLDQRSLIPIIVAGRGRLQLGVP